MFSWDELLKVDPLVLTVVGMAKNAGKTVTLNYLQKELHTKGIALGLTSIGRDGERYDALTRLPKPAITVPSGTLVATASKLITDKKAWERLVQTGIQTPLGEVEILRSKSEAALVLAGPSQNSQVRRVLHALSGLGVQCCLIDGAFDRQSSADPMLSHQVILATGATLSQDLKQVITITRARVEQFTLPVVPENYFFTRNCAYPAKILLFDGQKPKEFPVTSSLLSKDQWLRILANSGTLLMVKGAVGEGLGEALLQTKKPPVILVQDGSKIFISPNLWAQLKAKNICFHVQKSINLLGVTVNPSLPGGKGLEPELLLQEMGRALYPVPVIDVMRKKKFG